MKNKKRFVPWLIAAVIIAAFAVIGKKLYDLMFGGSLAVTTEDLKNGIIACSPAIIFIVVVLIAALIVVVAAESLSSRSARWCVHRPRLQFCWLSRFPSTGLFSA